MTEIHLRDYMTKNHREGDTTKSTEAFIVQTGDLRCPVALIRHYLSLLNADNPFLWQKPNASYGADPTSKWYCNSKIGENTMAKMMGRISTLCNLSRQYTNHCVRATAITVLGRSYQENDIRTLSGHKSVNALGIYKRTSNETMTSMSLTLHNSFGDAATMNDDATASTSKSAVNINGRSSLIDNACDNSSSVMPNLQRSPIHMETTNEGASTSVSEPLLDKLQHSSTHASGDHRDCCLSFGASSQQVVAADELAMAEFDWDNLMAACLEAEKSVSLNTNVQSTNAIKKGNKIIILNNCSGTFNF